MEHLVSGYVSFRRKAFPEHRELFAELANGQSPRVLFITCSELGQSGAGAQQASG